MSKFREKAEAQTKQIIGQMLGDELLVREGQEELHHVDVEEGPAGDQDSHGVQAGMPKARPPRAGETDQGSCATSAARNSRRTRRAPSMSAGSIAAAILPERRCRQALPSRKAPKSRMVRSD